MPTARASLLDRPIELVRSWFRDLVQAGRGAAAGYGRHATSQFASAIAFRVLFSLVPLFALVVAILDLALPDSARQDIVDWTLETLPGVDSDGRVERAIEQAGTVTSITGALALAGFLWAASGMMSSIRAAFGMIWEGEAKRPFVRGKLFDFALVLATGLLVIVSFGLNLLTQVVAELGEDVADALGLGVGGRVLAPAIQIGASLVLTAAVFALLYRVVPAAEPRTVAVVSAAALAAIAVHLGTAVYAFYLGRFSDFHAIYGTLGATLGFLALVYLAALMLLLGAELAAAWPGGREGEKPRAAPGS